MTDVPREEKETRSRRNTVLVIDDSKDIHLLLEARLQREGVELHCALDPREGLGMARSLEPDLILLDVVMPRLSGFDLCRMLKDDPRTSPIPVIFLSASSEPVDRALGLDLGAMDFVAKPFDPVELRARVRSALRVKRYQDLLRERACIDALTGLWNREQFSGRMGENLGLLKRHGRTFAVVLMDIDHFKSINDTYGHLFGDRVLEGVGELLRDLVRTEDVPCRYGGEEIAIILGDTGEEGAAALAERTRAGLESMEFHFRMEVPTVTASFGVADTSVAADPGSVDEKGLVAAADEALYAAKAAGRNRVMRASRVGRRGPAEHA
ncbi:MAG: diguanylate cyclase [Planctomycetota bacterium]